MKDLTESALNFECDISDAKRTIREWPELVGVTPTEQVKATDQKEPWEGEERAAATRP